MDNPSFPVALQWSGKLGFFVPDANSTVIFLSSSGHLSDFSSRQNKTDFLDDISLNNYC
ncbi:hypothetical protein THIOSC13_970006 [uncultured Thiomicrorhabdus sp.]